MDRDSVADTALATDDPAVVAVVVVHEPDDRFARTLDALRRQTYRNLRVLVVEAVGPPQRDLPDGSPHTDQPTLGDLVAAHLPGAVVHRLDGNPGYGAAANEVLDHHELVEGALFFVFCHDDVAPDPGAVLAMVDAAQATGAGVVGAKLVAWDEPDRLLQVGALVDRAGIAVPAVERGERDQGQHDAARDVFEAAGGFVLVRADLFVHVGGFDEGITFCGDDLSLCWRAQLAGARVVAAGAARVRHREALVERMPPRRRAVLAERHRLRVLLTSYQRRTLLWVLPQLVWWSAVGAAVDVVRLRGRDVLGRGRAWWWNLRRPRSILVARRHVARFRQVRDRDLRERQIRGMVHPLLRLQRSSLAAGGRRRAVRDRFDAWAAAWPRSGIAALAVVAAVLVLGSRHLLTRGIPALGDLVPFGSSHDLVDGWLSTWRPTGLGADAAAPTALGVLGGVGTLAGGHEGLVRAVAILVLVPLGLCGMLRMLRRTSFCDQPDARGRAARVTERAVAGSGWAPIVGVAAYALVPVPYVALADGRWGPLAAYAAAPTLLGALAWADGAAPFASTPWWGGVIVRQVVTLGLVGGLLGLVVPSAPLFVLLLAAGLAAGSLVVLDVRGAGRTLVAGVGGGLLALGLQFPWAVDLVDDWTAADAWWSALGGGRTGSTSPLDLLGWGRSLAAAPLSWGLLVAAALPLLIGRSWRASWAVRAWVVAAGGWALAWLASGPAMGRVLGDPGVPLAFSGAALAVAVGLGVAAVEHDVAGRSRRFGPRRSAVGLGALSLAAAAVPVLQSSLDGYWHMPRSSFGDVLAFLDRPEPDGDPPRLLWLGDPQALPVPGQPVDDQQPLAFVVTEGLPTLADRWSAPDQPGTDRIAEAADLAVTGQTARLGQLLAPMAVDYVVVPQRRAPSRVTEREWPAPAALVEALAGQLDLQRVGVDPAALVFRNVAAQPERSVVVDPAALDATAAAEVLWSAPLAAGADAIVGEAVVLGNDDGYGRWTGPVPAGQTVVLATQSSARWVLEVDGEPVARRAAFGWANAFDTATGGHAVLRYETSAGYHLILVGQLALWLAAVAVAVRLRRRAWLADATATTSDASSDRSRRRGVLRVRARSRADDGAHAPPAPAGSTSQHPIEESVRLVRPAERCAGAEQAAPAEGSTGDDLVEEGVRVVYPIGADDAAGPSGGGPHGGDDQARRDTHRQGRDKASDERGRRRRIGLFGRLARRSAASAWVQPAADADADTVDSVESVRVIGPGPVASREGGGS